MMINPYALLGVSENASASEIRKKYFELAKIFHPDLNEGKSFACQYMKSINEAWDRLKTPESRANTDLVLALQRLKERNQARTPKASSVSSQSAQQVWKPSSITVARKKNGQASFTRLAIEYSKNNPSDSQIKWALGGLALDLLFAYLSSQR